MIYREMETTPPAKPPRPPRREWLTAQMLRDGDSFTMVVAFAVVMVSWAVGDTVAEYVVPLSRDDTQAMPADVRCIRSRGVWNAGEIDGKRAWWCSWGQR